MKYEKPEIVAVAQAIHAIQGSCSKTQNQSDCESARTLHTDGSAYEADE
jgi:hypothetical protein